jgi:hypothetical protein
MAKAVKKAKVTKQERRERRFFPQATTSVGLVGALGGLGALAVGAGFWAQWGRVLFLGKEDALPFGWWIVVAGAVLVGIAIWIGTSGDPLLRVGDGGVGEERGGFFGTQPLRRIPWYGVESVAFDGASAAIVTRGRDEGGSELVIQARVKSQPQAAAWIVSEARTRIPAVMSVGEEVTLPEPRTEGAEVLTLDPVQVVGKRCAASGKVIAFEPDARVCPRCERVYHKDHVPSSCSCGGALATEESAESAPDDAEPAQPHATHA